MARKGLLTSIIAPQPSSVDAGARADYARRGASRAMMLSLDEIAQNSSRLLEGEAVVSLDPGLVDASPVADRMQLDDDDYRALVGAMRKDGQGSPILVRPHPHDAGRYMVVFGRRRLRAAAEIGIPVLAVVKPLEDVAAIVAQGQENSARADLSFIERAMFARKLLELGHTKETAKSALTVDDTLLSRMLSVAEVVPSIVISALGASKGVGRDRWEELKKLVLSPKNAETAKAIVTSPDFIDTDAAEQFNLLLQRLHTQPARKPATQMTAWSSPDKRVAAKVSVKGKSVNIALSSSQSAGFGIWLSEHLDDFYRDWQQAQAGKVGHQGD